MKNERRKKMNKCIKGELVDYGLKKNNKTFIYIYVTFTVNKQ